MRRFQSLVLAALIVLSALSGVADSTPVQAAERWLVTSPQPQSDLVAEITQSATDRRLSLQIRSGQTTVVQPSALGITTADTEFTSQLTFLGRTDRRVTEHYTTTVGKRLLHDAVANETTLRFQNSVGKRIDLVVRVADDGVAYRYVLHQSGTITVTGEASAFQIPRDSTGWLLPYTPWYEEERFESPLADVPEGDYAYPSLFEVTPSRYVLLTEADVDGRYAGSWTRLDPATGTFQVILADPEVISAGPLATQWRVAIVGDLATVTESDLVQDLAPPSKIADTSWIRPGVSAWSWWSEFTSPSNFERQKQFVDYARQTGWEYVLVDDGWKEEWLPDLVRYARQRGVEIILWTPWWTLDTDEKRNTTLALWKSWGVAGLKIDFMNSDSQDMFKWYDAVLAKTAEMRLLVNFHGATIPRGIDRTWPHVMTLEAVRGAETYVPALLNSEINTIYPFTRNIVGSMDYTPVTFSTPNRDSSDGHELGLSVVYESGQQHFADSIDEYTARPVAKDFLSRVPTVWDETQLLGGRPGDGAIFARRSGSDWFIGAIFAGPAQTVQVPLDFLKDELYLAEVFRDGPNGGLIMERSTVSRATPVSVAVPQNGGFTVHLCKAQATTTTCAQPIRPAPDTTLSVTPAEVVVNPGATFGFAANFTLQGNETISDVRFSVRAPTGWQISAPTLPERYAQINPGQTVSNRWTATIPQSAARGVTELIVRITYALSGSAHTSRTIVVEEAIDILVPPEAPTSDAYVSDMFWLAATNGWGPAERDMANGEAEAGDGSPITIEGSTYAKGIGAHAFSSIKVYAGKNCTTFSSVVGVDDAVSEYGSVTFEVYGDGRLLAATDVLTFTDPGVALNVDVSGVNLLELRVTDAGDMPNFDHADWANAMLHCGS